MNQFSRNQVITHQNVDLDACASVWAVQTFIPKFKDAVLAFVPAFWSGEDIVPDENRIAVDIAASGHGIKGKKDPDGTVHSAFAEIISKHASTEEAFALRHLVKFVEAQDSTGSAYKAMVPGIEKEALDVLSSTGLNAVLRCFQSTHRQDRLVVERMGEIFSGMLSSGLARLRGEKEADAATVLPGGMVALVDNTREFSTNGILFERGVKAIVYMDDYDLGLIREGTVKVRMDHPSIRAVVEEAGEQIGDGDGLWFAHPAGFLFARGTRKAPSTSPSKVSPMALAEALSKLF